MDAEAKQRVEKFFDECIVTMNWRPEMNAPDTFPEYLGSTCNKTKPLFRDILPGGEIPMSTRWDINTKMFMLAMWSLTSCRSKSDVRRWLSEPINGRGRRCLNDFDIVNAVESMCSSVIPVVEPKNLTEAGLIADYVSEDET